MKSIASAPGKVILFGEHFVVYGVKAILCSINKRVTVTAEKTSERKISINSKIGKLELEPDKPISEINSPLKPFYYLANKAVENKDTGIHIQIDSEIPLGAGLGSSSCCVAGAAAIFKLFGDISKEKILKLAIEAERTIFENTSGADCTVCTYGGIMEYDKNNGFKKIEDKPNLRYRKANMLNILINNKISQIKSNKKAIIALFSKSVQKKVKSVIYVSPNFGPSSYKGHFLRLPGAKWFIPLILGNEHAFTPRNSEHARCWTTRYPTKALFPVKDAVVAASLVNHSKIKLPILFWFSDYDKVVSPKATRRIISKMGNNVDVFNPIVSFEDDPSKHGVLGDILSPTKTAQGVNKILEWIRKNN